jgi:hypothetical protein
MHVMCRANNSASTLLDRLSYISEVPRPSWGKEFLSLLAEIVSLSHTWRLLDLGSEESEVASTTSYRGLMLNLDHIELSSS